VPDDLGWGSKALVADGLGHAAGSYPKGSD
jgi:hypothetical protein